MLLLSTACVSSTTSSLFETTDISIADEPLTVWFADEPAERRQGLQGVEDLPENVDGMLFAYQLPVGASFNMRNTVLHLDIWWFDDEGVLIGTTQMEPCRTDPCTTYRSPGLVRWVLETVQGEFDFGSDAVLSTSGKG